MYDTLNVNIPGGRRTKRASLGGVKGLNNIVAPEFQDLETAQVFKAYRINQEGQLEKVKGYTEDYDNAGGSVAYGSAGLKFDTNKRLYAFGDTIVYNNNGSKETLKDDFTTTDDFSMITYGDFVYACNGGDKIGIFVPDKKWLDYDAQSVNFTIGETVTGGTSNATGVVEYDIDGGAAGTLVLSSVTGTFQNNENITGDVTGDATTDGTPYNFYEISTAPKAKVLHFFNGRLVAGLGAEIKYCTQDVDLTIVPFRDWTTISSPAETTDAGSIDYRRAKDVTTIGDNGRQLIVGYEDGKAGYRIEFIDISGVGLSQKVETDFFRIDFGMSRGAISTPFGTLFGNEGGFWLLPSELEAQSNSRFEQEISNVLGPDIVSGLDLIDFDAVYDPITKSAYMSVREGGASFNNVVFIYNFINRSLTRIPNWQVRRFVRDGDTFYGVSSLTDKAFKLFDSNQNNGVDIIAEFQQEIPLSGLNDLHRLITTEIKGFFDAGTNLVISFDKYNKQGEKEEDVLSITLTVGAGNSTLLGFNQVGFNRAPFNGGLIDPDDQEILAKKRTKIRKATRLIAKYRSEDGVGHKITWAGYEIEGAGINTTKQNLT